jgi:tetratricopeptide (TPR) repeat protein
LIAAPVWAQPGQITSAALSFNEGKYHDAIAEAKKGLSKPETLNEKQSLKGNSVLIRSYLMLYNDALKDDNKRKALMDKYPTLLADSWESYSLIHKSALKDYKDEIKGVLPVLGSALFYQSRELRDAGKIGEALTTINRADEIYKTTGKEYYFISYSRAFIRLANKTNADSVAAIADFEKAISLYQKPAKDDGSSVSGAYAMLIRLYGRTKKDVSKALEISGKASSVYPDDEDIRSAELDVYLLPELFDQAVDRFKKELVKNPGDVTTLKIYANLLERKAAGLESKGAKPEEIEAAMNEAIEKYRQVIEKGGDKAFANFNLGAIFYNRAVKNQKDMDALPLDKQKEYDSFQALKKQNLEKAEPYMKACVQLEPKNVNAIRTLMSISTELGKMEDREKYKKMLQELGVPMD